MRNIGIIWAVIVCFVPAIVHSATVEGNLVRDGGVAITDAFVQALDPANPQLGAVAEGDVNEGYFSFTIDYPGNYEFEIIPFNDGVDQLYRAEFIGPFDIPADDPDPYDLGTTTLYLGGNIKGTITRPDDTGDWNNEINITVFDENGQYITWGNVDWSQSSPFLEDGETDNPEYAETTIEYTTNAVAGGSSYIVSINSQHGEYHTVYYDNVPGWSEYDATPVNATNNTSTTGIDFELSDANEEQYWISWFGPYTTHLSTPVTNSTYSGAGFEMDRFSDGRPVHPDKITSILLSSPAGIFTNSTSSIDAFWRVQWFDNDGNGIIDDPDEWESGPFAVTYFGGYFDIDTGAPHPAGDYTLTVGLENGSTLTKTFTGAPAGLSTAALPPVESLNAYYDNFDDSLTFDWTLPISYPGGVSIEIRLNLFKGGEFINNQLRIRDLPADITGFTFDEDMTVMFNTGRADQISVEVIVKGGNGTKAKTKKSYSFNAETGVLTPGPIRATFDVNGDGRTGLEEAIHSLQVITSP